MEEWLPAKREGVLEECCLLGERECWRGAAGLGRGSVGGVPLAGGVLPAGREGVLEECCLLGEREC